MKTKTNAEILSSLKKANKDRKVYMATKAGFKTVDEYKDFLSLEEPTAKNRCFEPNKKETIHIVNIVDVSGSMRTKIDKALEGINSEVNKLKQENSVDYNYTLVSFSYHTNIKTVIDNQPISKVEEIKLKTDGYTALNQAVGETLTKLKEVTKNERVLVSIFTDGEENDSRGIFRDNSTLSKLIEDCKALGFTITFIGTKYDVDRVVRELKIDESNTLVHNNTSKGIADSFSMKFTATASYSEAVSRGVKQEDLLTGFYKTTGKL